MKQNNPLLFISSISTEVEKGSSQKIFDSRRNKASKEVDLKVYREIKHAVDKYNNNDLLLYNVNYDVDSSVVGTPKEIVDGKLVIEVNEGKYVDVLLNSVTNISLLKI